MQIPTISTILLFAYFGTFGYAQEQKTNRLADFNSKQSSLLWKTVNDSVMGGISRGGWQFTERNSLLFSGATSLDNNGGFSSIRTYGQRHNLSGYDGIELKVKGDGRMYYLTSRTNSRRMIAYWSPIQTQKGKWLTVRIPFSSFYATSFGRKIPGMRLNPKNITSIGFMLYDKKAGDFSIEVDDIVAYQKPKDQRIGDHQTAPGKTKP